MDVVVIFNGLGNQMSQYSLYLSKKKKNPNTRCIFNKASVHHNGYELDKAFGIDYPSSLASELLFFLYRLCVTERYPIIKKYLNWFFHLIKIRLIKEKENYDFSQDILTTSKGINFYIGGWHSEKYFKDILPDIKNTFVFNTEQYNEKVLQIISQIQSVNSSVSIHVRRGDYFLLPENYNGFGVVCPKEYYYNAIEYIQDHVSNPHFFVFSDDFSWVRENIKLENATYVEINSGKDSWIDMYLISLCKHNINANSTFSWWGAWLNKNEEKIILRPEYFINNLITNDFYPGNWIQIGKR